VKHVKVYPKVDNLLQQSRKTNRALHLQRRQQEMVDKIKAAIQELEALGQPVTQRAIGKVIGKSPKGFYRYPEVAAFLDKEMKEKRRRDQVQQKRQRENRFFELVLEAREQLQTRGIPFSVKALAKHAHTSYNTLHRYPRVREMLERLKQECSQTDKHKIEDK